MPLSLKMKWARSNVIFLVIPSAFFPAVAEQNTKMGGTATSCFLTSFGALIVLFGLLGYLTVIRQTNQCPVSWHCGFVNNPYTHTPLFTRVFAPPYLSPRTSDTARVARTINPHLLVNKQKIWSLILL